MHNWFEMSAYSRERMSDLIGLSDSIRTARVMRRSLRLSANAAEANRIAPASEQPKSGRDATGARATFIMEKGEVFSIRVGRRPYRIACIAGRLWTTMDGSMVDLVLAPGESLAYRGRGKVVVQALRTATIRVECPSDARVFLSSALRPAVQRG